jgi:phenylpropionate dioxygenase-like ring-hydroxylating dioxygenase large terminal subunit
MHDRIKEKYYIDPDIKKAETLPAEFYRDEAVFESSKENVFAKTWQFAGDTDLIKIPGQVYPFTLNEGFLNEPLLLTRDYDDKIHCMSNVCTHRGNILIENPDVLKVMQCRYHGRRFNIDGSFRSMPECEDAENFPTEKDNLSRVEFGLWNQFIFVSLEPSAPLNEFVDGMNQRLSWLDMNQFIFEPTRSRDYLVKANWVLYCDNYLEGFHIPYVHSGLNEKLDYGNYRSEIYKYSNLQLAIVRSGEESFRLPESSPDYGNEIAAYYYWIFPNMMFNFYPWGLSINIVKPLAKDLTKISYMTYVRDPSKLEKGAGSGLDRVEREDEAIVENVQRGISSRLYNRGRYSPKREAGVHHFHRLLTNFHK